MKKAASCAQTISSSKKSGLSAGQARLQAGQVNAKKTTADISEVTFKGGLRNMNVKYAISNSAYKVVEQWCLTALAKLACVWITGRKTDYESVHMRYYLKSCRSVRSIRDILELNISDEELLYVMNAYIFGITNTASPSDAQSITCDYEMYISSNNTLTTLQKKTLLKGFAAAKNSFKRGS